ncbi:HNH endonuclease [Paenibacillus sp. TAB 01]|uniref:HNH endonuclease n=1 Tax=Paenibacillus sp. TAB 01 TaxID=3368988 RepID=UPI003752348E
MAIRKLCNKPGCGELIAPGEIRCAKHPIDTSERHRYYDKHQRDQIAKAFYESKEWRRLRAVVIKKCFGLCARCKAEKRIRAGYILDHIIPIAVAWELRLEESNLQYLCHAHHNMKTWEDKKLYG